MEETAILREWPNCSEYNSGQTQVTNSSALTICPEFSEVNSLNSEFKENGCRAKIALSPTSTDITICTEVNKGPETSLFCKAVYFDSAQVTFKFATIEKPKISLWPQCTKDQNGTIVCSGTQSITCDVDNCNIKLVINDNNNFPCDDSSYNNIDLSLYLRDESGAFNSITLLDSAEKCSLSFKFSDLVPYEIGGKKYIVLRVVYNSTINHPMYSIYESVIEVN